MLDPTFSEHSYGFRPGRRAHDAVLAAQSYVQSGRRVVVDVDLEKFFDRVNHDILMDRLQKRIEDAGVIRLIRAYLNSGIMERWRGAERHEGTPQGGPLSPLLANVLLDEVDKELERRGHCFVRYADDCNVYVRSRRAGERVMALLRRLYGKLQLDGQRDQERGGQRVWPQVPGLQLLGGPGRRDQTQGGRQAAGDVQAAHPATDPPLGWAQHAARWWIGCGPICWDGRRTSGWRKRPGSGASWTSGCVTGCGPSSSSTGSAARRCTGNCWRLGRQPTVARRVAANSRRWWRNSGMLAQQRADHCLLRPTRRAPTLMTSTSRTARCGPACRVVWQGCGPQWPPPMPICLGAAHVLIGGPALIPDRLQGRHAPGYTLDCLYFCWSFAGVS